MKTVYLTGAPAAGKSTTARLLKQQIPGLKIWEYGAELTRYVKERAQIGSQADLRRLSANVVTPEDVAAVDKELLEFVNTNRGTYPIVIDSHPVTKEDFGYRITAFSEAQVKALAPDEIWVLFTPPNVTVERINSDAEGRPQIDHEEARMHTSLQAGVAATYGVAIGRPVYLFDSSIDQAALIRRLGDRLSR
ncbi:ATP-binding protein [Sinorhizobium fredii]|nr:ATP-binding protein [Sinorhizobium fredii]